MTQRTFILLTLQVVVFLCCVLLVTWLDLPRTKTIDCRNAEFHPDYTPAMREACRKAGHA